MALACSQQKAESGLLNFSRWRIKQAVADVPTQGELAGLKLSAPACPQQPVPSPREMLSAVASAAGTGCGWGSLPRYVSCRLNSSPWPSGEGKEAQEGAGQGAASTPQGDTALPGVLVPLWQRWDLRATREREGSGALPTEEAEGNGWRQKMEPSLRLCSREYWQEEEPGPLG